MKFLHIADVHLGAVPDKGSPWSQTRAQEIWQTFRDVLQRAQEEQADLLLIAGDLFHRPPTMRELKEVNYLLGRLQQTQVVIIAGNHDYLTKDSCYHGFLWAENVVFLGGKTCEGVRFPWMGATVYGLSYHAQEIAEPLYDHLEPDEAAGCQILLAHGGDAAHIPIDRRRLLESRFDYIALGHIHKPQSLARDRMAYAGALEPLDVNDTGAHGYILGEYHAGKLHTEFVPFACREYVHLTLHSTEGMTDAQMREMLACDLERYGRQHIYRVRIEGVRDPDIIYQTEQYAALGNLLSVEDETTPDYDFEELRRIHGTDVVGRYIDCLWTPQGAAAGRRKVQQQALYYGVRALLK